MKSKFELSQELREYLLEKQNNGETDATTVAKVVEYANDYEVSNREHIDHLIESDKKFRERKMKSLFNPAYIQEAKRAIDAGDKPTVIQVFNEYVNHDIGVPKELMEHVMLNGDLGGYFVEKYGKFVSGDYIVEDGLPLERKIRGLHTQVFNEGVVPNDVKVHILTGTRDADGVLQSGGHGYSVFLEAQKEKWFNESDLIERPNGVRTTVLVRHPNPLRRYYKHSFFPKGWNWNKISPAISKIQKDKTLHDTTSRKTASYTKIGVVDNVRIVVKFHGATDDVITAHPDTYQ